MAPLPPVRLQHAPTVVALSASLLLHSAFPFLNLSPTKKAEARAEIEIITVAPAPLTPDADEAKDGDDGLPGKDAASDPVPDLEGAPETGAEPDVPEPDVPEPDVPEPEPTEEAPVDDMAAPEPVEEPPAPAEPEPEPVETEPVLPIREMKRERLPDIERMKRLERVRKRQQALRDQLLERRRKRAAEIRRRRALQAQENRRQARAKKARRGRRRGGKGAPHPALKTGTPEDVWACEANERGIRARVRADRPVEEWAILVPTVLVPFDTDPGLMDYLGEVTQITKRRRREVKRVGRAEFALPAHEIAMELDVPLGVKAYLGRRDARCLVGLDYQKKTLFPLTLKRVPVRLEDQSGNVRHALVDIEFDREAHFKLKHRSGDVLPFDSGALKNAPLIAQTIDAHYAAAQAARQMAALFGIDLNERVKEEQLRRWRQRQAIEASVRAAQVPNRTRAPTVKKAEAKPRSPDRRRPRSQRKR